MRVRSPPRPYGRLQGHPCPLQPSRPSGLRPRPPAALPSGRQCHPWPLPPAGPPPGGRTSGRPCSCAEWPAALVQTNHCVAASLDRWTARGGRCPGAGVAGRAQPTNPPAADRCPLRSEGQHRVSEGQDARRERPGDRVRPPRACGTQDAAKPARFRQSGRSGTGVDSPGSVAVFPWHPVQPPLTHRMASDTHDSGQPRRREMPVWLPWLAAPAFALLPIAGCGAAATLRHTAHKAPAPAVASRPLVPITAVVTALPPGR